VEFNRPFSPFSATTTSVIANLERRAAVNEQALAVAREDLANERARRGMLSEPAAAAERARERERIKAIVNSPLAARQPRLALALAMDDDCTFAKAEMLMKAHLDDLDGVPGLGWLAAGAKQAAVTNPVATAEGIINAGRRRRGELPTQVTAGAKPIVTATAAAILAAAAKRDAK
jgi:hypothetical protein